MSNETLKEEIAIALFRNGSESWKKKTSEETKAYYRELAEITLNTIDESKESSSDDSNKGIKAKLAETNVLLDKKTNEYEQLQKEIDAKLKEKDEEIKKLETQVKDLSNQIKKFEEQTEKAKTKNEVEPKK